MTPLLLALDFGGTKHAAALVAAGEKKRLELTITLLPISSTVPRSMLQLKWC